MTHGLEPHASGGKAIDQAELQEDSHMEIIVTDDGVGMEPERLEQLKITPSTFNSVTSSEIKPSRKERLAAILHTREEKADPIM
ncbi:hypothetical protein FHS16_000406 [Paenibacillus endophyticus]|uniref:Uncharacterized protein n=1 Tax=Paenibacillus endophyticus TaxID=1294268 RepID=A0A7W5C492_9BACL|nr:hypothetical protein [Paenibacillus endophyticus]MBB3150374.1 hypothetical protein [Paenibacillus endophyticus]